VHADHGNDHHAQVGQVASADHLIHDLLLEEGRQQAQTGVQRVAVTISGLQYGRT